MNQIIPEWVTELTFAIQHNPNCPEPYLIRFVGKGAAVLDLNPDYQKTRDSLGFGLTPAIAAERAKFYKNWKERRRR